MNSKVKENHSESVVSHPIQSDSYPTIFFFCKNHESAKNYNNSACVKQKCGGKKTLENKFMFFGQHFACTSKSRRIDAELGFCSSEITLLSRYLTYKYVRIGEIKCTITHEFDRLLRRWKYSCLFWLSWQETEILRSLVKFQMTI